MCDGCPLQETANTFPRSMITLRFWDGRTGKPDAVRLSVTRAWTDPLVANAPTCREAVAVLLRLMDGKRERNE
jgi:hypothetical protein